MKVLQGTKAIIEEGLKCIHKVLEKKTLTLSVVGAGGKTGSVYFLADKLKDKVPVVVTTTTAMFKPENIPVYYLREEVPGEVGIYSLFQREENSKVFGFSSEEMDEFIETRDKNLILCEADGAKRKSLKAYGDHEPPIPVKTDLVLLVLGIDVLGKPLEEDIVHRSQEFTKITGRKEGEVITLEDYFTLILHKDGFMKNIPSHAPMIVFFNKMDSLGVSLDEEAVARRLLEHPKVVGVLYGSMIHEDFTKAYIKSSPC